LQGQGYRVTGLGSGLGLGRGLTCHFQVMPLRPAASGCHGAGPREPRFCAARWRASGSGLGAPHLVSVSVSVSVAGRVTG
jgi:hypothetical protein